MALKDVLGLSERAQDFSIAIQEAEKRLLSKEPLKASVIATIIRTFGKARRMTRALEVFNSIGQHSTRKRPSSYHYAAILTACADNANWEDALAIVDRMRSEKRSRPNAVVYTAAMTACTRAGRYKDCLDIFDTISAEGVPLDVGCYNCAITACSHTGKYSKAFDMLEEMTNAHIRLDEVTYGAMLSCCEKAGDWVLANNLLNRARASKHVTINEIMITSAMGAFTEGGQPQRAIELFNDTRETQTEKSMPLTYPIYIAALKALRAITEGSDGDKRVSAVSMATREGGGAPHTLQALHILREMARRHIRMTSFALATAMRVMEAEGAYMASQEVYELGVKNRLFSAEVANVDEDRRIDLRESHPSMVRAVLRSTLTKLYGGDAEIQDILIVLGKGSWHVMCVLFDRVMIVIMYSFSDPPHP